MKFEPKNWEVLTDEAKSEGFTVPRGVLRLMCSELAKVWVEDFGGKALAAVAHEIRLKVDPQAVVTLECDGDVFLYAPGVHISASAGETFTNADRMISESGTLFEVSKAVRKMQLEAQTTLKAIRRERLAHEAAASARRRLVEAERREASSPKGSDEAKAAATAAAKASADAASALAEADAARAEREASTPHG